MALNSGLTELSFATEFQRTIDRLRGPSGQIEQMLGALRDAVDPPALRAIREMHQAMSPLAKQLGLAERTALQHHRTCSAFAPSLRLAEMTKPALLNCACANALGQGNEFASFRAMRDPVSDLGNMLNRQILTVQRLDRMLRGVLPDATRDIWSNHLKEFVMPATSFLSAPQNWPTALLSQLSGKTAGASIAWLSGHESAPKLALAALTEESVAQGSRVDLEIEAEVVCVICEEPLFSPKQTLRWIGPRRGVIRVGAFPICSQCMKEAGGDPSFWDEALRNVTRPKLRVLDGGREGPASPKGSRHLRLVMDENEGDSDNEPVK